MDNNTLERLYNGADVFMIQQARSGYNSFVAERPAFEALDVTYTSAWAAQWLAEIEAAEALLSDRFAQAQQAEKTELVMDAMDVARNKWGELKYFVQKAFPRDRTMLRVFGKDAYLPARQNQAKMMEFLTDLHGTATDYAAQLIAAGYTQSAIDDLLTARDALVSKNEVQNKTRRGRMKLTAQRIATLNAPYLRLTQVNAAAQIVYMQDAARRGQYIYRRAPRKKDKKETEGAV